MASKVKGLMALEGRQEHSILPLQSIKNENRKMRVKGYGIKMKDGARIWGALQA